MFSLQNFRLKYVLNCLYLYLFDFFYKSKRKVINGGKPKIAIICTDAIGDYILVRNFIEELKSSFSHRGYEIVLIGNELYKDIAINFDKGLINNFLWFNKNSLKTSFSYRRNFLTQVGLLDIEIAINPSYSRDFIFGDSLIRACNAKIKIGQMADLANGYAFFRWLSNFWYTKLIDTGKNIQFEFDRNKFFFEKITESKFAIKAPTFPVSNHITGTDKHYIVMFPGAGEVQKQWSINNFTDCTKYFLEKTPYKIIICGSKQDFELGEFIRKASNTDNVKNLCGLTTLTQLSEYIAQAKLLITNDSSALHIAACTKTKAICVGNGRHFGRFTPYPKEGFDFLVFLFPQKVVEHEKRNIEELKKRTIYKSIDNINSVTVAEVINASKSLLTI